LLRRLWRLIPFDFIHTKGALPMTANQLPESQRQRCEVWTRVMGYHRPVTAFNAGKQSEHRERRHFREAR
jgi:hypothetical protein